MIFFFLDKINTVNLFLLKVALTLTSIRLAMSPLLVGMGIFATPKHHINIDFFLMYFQLSRVLQFQQGSLTDAKK